MSKLWWETLVTSLFLCTWTLTSHSRLIQDLQNGIWVLLTEAYRWLIGDISLLLRHLHAQIWQDRLQLHQQCGHSVKQGSNHFQLFASTLCARSQNCLAHPSKSPSFPSIFLLAECIQHPSVFKLKGKANPGSTRWIVTGKFNEEMQRHRNEADVGHFHLGANDPIPKAKVVRAWRCCCQWDRFFLQMLQIRHDSLSCRRLKVAIFFSGNAEDALEKARGLAKALAAATIQAVKWGERVIWLWKATVVNQKAKKRAIQVLFSHEWHHHSTISKHPLQDPSSKQRVPLKHVQPLGMVGDPQVLSHEEKVLRLQVTMADLILVHVVDSTSVDSLEVKAGKHPQQMFEVV